MTNFDKLVMRIARELDFIPELDLAVVFARRIVAALVPERQPDKAGVWARTLESMGYHNGWNACRDELLEKLK